MTGKNSNGTQGTGVQGLSVQGSYGVSGLTATGAFTAGYTGTGQNEKISVQGSFTAGYTGTGFTTTGNNMVCATGTGTAGYVVQPNMVYTGIASFQSAGSSRSCNISLLWYNSAGASISPVVVGTSVTDNSAGFTSASVRATSPATAAYAALELTVISPSEVHYANNIGLFLGTNTTWGPGGLSGIASAVIQRSDGAYVRYASLNNPAPIAASVQTLDVGDYVATASTNYTYGCYLLANVNGSNLISATATSNSASVQTFGWWEILPTDYSTAVSAQIISWQAQVSEQATAHLVMGQAVPNIVASNMGGLDGTGEFETFDPVVYQNLTSLLQSQTTVFLLSPWGSTDTGYVRFGPATNSSGGSGHTVKNSSLMPGTLANMHRTTGFTWVAQARPPV